MSALAPMVEESPPLQPETVSSATADEKRRPRNKPIMSAAPDLLERFAQVTGIRFTIAQ